MILQEARFPYLADDLPNLDLDEYLMDIREAVGKAVAAGDIEPEQAENIVQETFRWMVKGGHIEKTAKRKEKKDRPQLLINYIRNHKKPGTKPRPSFYLKYPMILSLIASMPNLAVMIPVITTNTGIYTESR